MESRTWLLQLLNDREFLTGPVLGKKLGISRSAVHKHISALQQSGLPIERVRGRGYKLAQHVAPLSERVILECLGDGPHSRLGRLWLEQSVDSTNSVLRRFSKEHSIHASVCIAESQSSGRGRRGNLWVASPYRNLLMSVGWEYNDWPRELTTLAPAAGIAIVEALADAGVTELGIKWPNDIVHNGRKLGGVLIDVSGETDGVCTLIVGVGINVNISDQDGAFIDQPWTDLLNVVGRSIDRNRLTAACITHLFTVLSRYEQSGFEPYRQRWSELDVLAGHEVSILMHDGGRPVSGTAKGIDREGALRVCRYGGEEIRCYHGEVSVRAQ